MLAVETEKKRNKKKGIDFNLKNSDFGLSEDLKFKLGTVDDKLFPKTVYISLSFWFDLNKENILDDFESESSFNRFFRRKINEIYINTIAPIVKENSLFPCYDSNIFYYDVPHNVVYSNKRCFCSIDITLHTSNVYKRDKDFIEDINSEIFKELVSISKHISNSEFFNTNKYYSIHNRKK